MTNPALNDLTCALPAGVVRNVQRDLNSVHESDECDCEMCRAANEYEAREAREDEFPVSEAENVSTPSMVAGIAPLNARTDPVQALFDALWLRTPLVIQESTEQGIAEYFYRIGYADAREVGIETANDDLVEMRRLAGKRLR